MNRNQPRRRFNELDIVRLVAAVGIVWFHTPGAEYRNVGYAGLIAFMMMTALLGATSGQRSLETPSDFGALVLRRATSLVVPWLVWVAFYTAENAAIGRATFPYGDTVLDQLLAGPRAHLWYLPAAFVAALVSAVCGALLGGGRSLVPWFGALAVALGLLWMSASADRNAITAPWGQWIHIVAAVPLGIAIASLPEALPDRSRRLLLSAFPIALGGWCFFIIDAPPSVAIPYTVGTTLVCAALAFPIARRPLLERLAGWTLGIYLLHALMFDIVWYVFPARPQSWVFTTCGVLGALIGTVALGYTPFAPSVGLAARRLRRAASDDALGSG